MKPLLVLLLGILIMGQTSCSESQPADKNDKETTSTSASIILAAGCFWCVEGIFEQLTGVINAESGYAGDSKEKANYETVSAGGSKHAEVVRIVYDPRKITLEKLFEVFFKTHNPTQLNGQGSDIGPQYRSAIFYANEQQKKIATAAIKKLTDAKYFDKPIVTTLEKLNNYYPAEKYHQDYVRLNPDQGYVRSTALLKMRKACTLFPSLIKKK